MIFQPVIKWSGSKRSQAEQIVSYFPKEIDTYYEPFVGGASVLFQLLHSDVKVKKYICSDINEELIQLWNIIKQSPSTLLENYTVRWLELNKDNDLSRKKDYYYKIRKKYNNTKDIFDFYFLTRTCVNGLIRYNSKGEFNSAFHTTRKGIEPKRLEGIIKYWSKKINEHDVQFIVQDYKSVTPNKNDFVYLDPPYANTDSMYYGKLNYEEFWGWLRSLKCGYLLSFDGISGNDNMTYDVPKDLYDKHVYIYNGISGFKKLSKKQEYVKESLYIKN